MIAYLHVLEEVGFEHLVNRKLKHSRLRPHLKLIYV